MEKLKVSFKPKPPKTIIYEHNNEITKNLYERHIQPDCEKCNNKRHYKKYVLQGLNLPCIDHIIIDPFDGNCPNIVKCPIDSLVKANKNLNLFDIELKNYTCSACNIFKIKDGEIVKNIYSCISCDLKFCFECVSKNMLMFENEPETYKCFYCSPYEKREAYRLEQIN